MPIVGKMHIGYLPGTKLIGLSRIHKLVHDYANRPQVQERLAQQIAKGLQEAVHTEDVAGLIDAVHYCVASRGIQHTTSNTVTAHYRGRFKQAKSNTNFFP